MRCWYVRRKLSAFLGEQISIIEKEKIQDHLLSCHNCSKQLEGLNKLDQALSVYSMVETGDDFVPNFWQKVRDIEARQVSPAKVGAYFYQLVMVILFLSLAVGVASGIFTAKYNAQEQFMSELKIDYLRDYPPNSLSGKNIVLASLK